jgi:hypothetical protein
MKNYFRHLRKHEIKIKFHYSPFVGWYYQKWYTPWYFYSCQITFYQTATQWYTQMHV